MTKREIQILLLSLRLAILNQLEIPQISDPVVLRLGPRLHLRTSKHNRSLGIPSIVTPISGQSEHILSVLFGLGTKNWFLVVRELRVVARE